MGALLVGAGWGVSGGAYPQPVLLPQLEHV